MSPWKTRLRRVPAKLRGGAPVPKAATDTFYLVSFPKSGRTWLRFLVANYLVSTFDLDLEVDFRTVFHLLPNNGEHPERGRPAYRYADDDRVPLILCSHSSFKPHWAGRPVFTIVRSPLDTLVSYYFHREHHRSTHSRSIQEHLRDPELGVGGLIDHYNSWAGELTHGRSLVVGYEQLKAEPREELRALWPFLGLPEDEAAVDYAIERSRFETLKKLEEREQLPGSAYDVENPDARRVRRGEVGGWRDDLGEEDAEYVRERCRGELSEDAKALLRPFWPDVL